MSDVNRRDFLKTIGAGAAALALPDTVEGRGWGRRRQCTPSFDINQKLCDITTVLRNSDAIENVKMHMVCNPTKSLVQWRWAHFLPEVAYKHIPEVEKVNSHLLNAMKQVKAVPSSGLDQLLQEGMVEGKEKEFIQFHRVVTRDLLYMNLRTPPLFSNEKPKQPTEEDIDKAFRDPEVIRERITHYVRTYYGNNRRIHFSPLGRGGAGYFLSEHTGTTLLATEDPQLDKKAEKANYEGTEEEFQSIVLAARDAHFLKVVRGNRRLVQHILLGSSHDLTDDITKSNNEHRDQISHIVVTPKGFLPKENS